ncbi:hypothetical protein ABEF95_005247 [Exophiala dermatitidis]
MVNMALRAECLVTPNLAVPPAARTHSSESGDEEEVYEYPFRNGPPPVVYRQSKHPLPYFAHQQLDPDYFPEDLGAPVGGPKDPLDASNQAWDDDDDDTVIIHESDADEYGDDEDDAGVEIPTPKSGRKQKSKLKTKLAAKPAVASDVKHMKMPGGRPAVAKKVSADLDSDDELIVRMKEARFLERDIAQALIDQGRTAYNPKTIGTRWRRIKHALQQRQDELLDADLSDWHEGDDEVLVDAVAKAEKETERAIAEAEARKWRIVADRMKLAKPVINFSHKACRERYEALLNGTAKPTPESVENPGPEVLARIESRKQKELKIAKDMKMSVNEQQNVQGNGWSSRKRIYF